MPGCDDAIAVAGGVRRCATVDITDITVRFKECAVAVVVSYHWYLRRIVASIAGVGVFGVVGGVSGNPPDTTVTDVSLLR